MWCKWTHIMGQDWHQSNRRALWNIWWVWNWIFLIKAISLPLWFTTGWIRDQWNRKTVSELHIFDEPSLLNHRYKCFQTWNIATTIVTFRDHKRTNWETYKDGLRVHLEAMLWNICSIWDTDLLLTSCNKPSFCPITATVRPGSLTRQRKYLIKIWVGWGSKYGGYLLCPGWIWNGALVPEHNLSH